MSALDNFGFDTVWEFTAEKFFEQNKNIYIRIEYLDFNENLQVTDMFIFDKKQSFKQNLTLKRMTVFNLTDHAPKVIFYTDNRTVVPNAFSSQIEAYEKKRQIERDKGEQLAFSL